MHKNTFFMHNLNGGIIMDLETILQNFGYKKVFKKMALYQSMGLRHMEI